MIKEKFEDMRIGTKRMKTFLIRKGILGTLTSAQIRWIYKRNGWQVQKVKTKNGETRSLYNYQTLWTFEHMHYDTKEIADQKSLPVSVYENLKHNEHLPLYEWNIMDMGSRTRFMAYSRWKNSTFWIMFLVYVLSHLRYCWINTTEQWWHHIRLHTDGWGEFFSWSTKKQQEWNDLLLLLDASIDCYNPNFDIRKNVIERSHRSDDEEFLIPFGAEMKTKEPFMIQAQEYSDYWNTKRSHSGHGMDGRTPREQLIKRGLSTIQAQRILDFKVLYLDESFYTLQEHFQYFLFQKELLETKKEKSQEKSQEKGQERLFEDRKTSLDLITRYAHLKHYAQNVLTYYHFCGIIRKTRFFWYIRLLSK